MNFVHVCTKGQLLSLTFFKVNQILSFSNSFSSEATGTNETKFYMAPPLIKGTQVYQNCYGHMTKMDVAIIAIDKNL